MCSRKKNAQGFISPDNVVQDPGSSQSYNRYTYCLNNPLKYIDLSGNSIWSWISDNWAPTLTFGLYGGLKYDEGISKGYSVGQSWLYAGANTAITAASAYVGAYVGGQVSGMLSFSGFWGGFVSGSAGSYAGVFINSFGTNLLSGKSIWNSYWGAQKDAHIGGLIGGTISGIISGLETRFSHRSDKLGDGLDLEGPEMKEEQIENEFKNQTGAGEGDYNIGDITTDPPDNCYLDNKYHVYRDMDNPRKIIYGTVDPPGFWTGKIDVHIAPYASRDIYFLRGVCTHEFQHVLQFNYGIVNLINVERNANLHELWYYQSLPLSICKTHNIWRMMQMCYLGL